MLVLRRSTSLPAIDWKGLLSYLVVCFGVTWSIEFAALRSGVRFDFTLSDVRGAIIAVGIAAAAMLIPALSGFVVRSWITREGFQSAGLRIGPWRAYLWIWMAVPIAYSLIYCLTVAVGLGVFSTAPLADSFRQLPGAHVPPIRILLVLLAVQSLLFAPFINTLFTFGEEFGWTGYLLPKLLPLGKWQAALLYGAIWGLWHAPLILGGFNYGAHRYLGILFMCFLTMAMALNQCAVRLRTDSVFATSFLHACFNAQGRGVWPMCVVVRSPLFGGVTGLISTLVIACIGGVLLRRTRTPLVVSPQG